MDCCGSDMNANSGSYNYFSSDAKVSFDGFINENYFLLDKREQNLVQNISITHAITKNPFNYRKDAFIGLFLKSKYDGYGNRHPIDISIALDVSGSMGTIDGNDGKSRIQLALESLTKLVGIMDQETDRISLITFNHETQKIFGLLDKNEIENKFLNDLKSIKDGGGTDLVLALKGAMDNMDINEEDKKIKKDKRIIMITDADYYDTDDGLFNLFKTCVEEKGIYITIIAISSNSNLTLTDKVCKYKGCNYFSITQSSDLETFLVKYYNYIFFPIAHELKLTVKSENSHIIKCIGADNEFTDEYENQDNTKVKDTKKEISFDLGSVFSSEIITIKDKEGEDKLYVKGGLILLKINSDDLNKNEDLKYDFTFEYISFDGNKSCQNYSYIIENREENKENYFFKDINIRKGISIYYFCIILNRMCEIEKETQMLSQNKERVKLKEKYINLMETRQTVSDYLKNNFILEPNNQETNNNLDNYFKIIDGRYSGFKYNLDELNKIDQ